MTSGHGVAHSEENPGLRSGEMHGMQLWVAQPSTTRDGGAEFEHFDTMPTIETSNSRDGPRRFLRRDEFTGPSRQRSGRRRTQSSRGSRHSRTGAELRVRAHRRQRLVLVDAPRATGALAYLGADETSPFDSNAPSRAMLIGAFPSTNASSCGGTLWRGPKTRSPTRARLAAGDDRFGRVASPFARIEVSPPRGSWRCTEHRHR